MSEQPAPDRSTTNDQPSPPPSTADAGKTSQRPSWQVMPQRGGSRIRVRYREGLFATDECHLCK